MGHAAIEALAQSSDSGGTMAAVDIPSALTNHWDLAVSGADDAVPRLSSLDSLLLRTGVETPVRLQPRDRASDVLRMVSYCGLCQLTRMAEQLDHPPVERWNVVGHAARY